MDRLLRTSFKLSTITPPSISMKQPSVQHCPFPGQLLATDSISWVVFECIEVNEDSFFMMQEMIENTGLKMLSERFKDPEVNWL